LALALQLGQPVLQASMPMCERQVVLLEQLVQRQLVLVLRELVALKSERKYLGVLLALALAAFRLLAYLLPADYFGSM
jgi:hypothetical protein